MLEATTAEPPLAGVRVLDLTHYVAGPYCTRLLADYGASVLKLERPGGDPARSLPPFLSEGETRKSSLLFLYLNHDKETETCDLATDAGRRRCLELAKEADVLVENFRPGTLARLGLGWEVLRALNARLVLTSISNFGQDGPYRDYRAWDIVADALGGLAYIFGYPEREPLTHANTQAQYRAGVYAASATVAALFNGGGEQVDVSIMECVAAALRDTIPQYTFMGAVRRRGGNPRGGFGSVTACADGHVIPTAYGAADWSTLTRFLDAPEMDDPRFATGEGRQQHAGELAELLRRRLETRRKLAFFHEAQAWGLGAGVVLTPAEVVECEQLAAREYLQPLEPGPLPAPRRPFEL